MFVVKKIEIYDVKGLAAEIASKMPNFEVDPDRVDEYGDFDEMFDIDIQVEVDGTTLDVLGKVRAQGFCRKVMSATHLCPEEYDFRQVNEIFEADYYIEGEEIEFDEKFDLENEINKLI